MKAIIANPTYDTVFKYLMSDDRVARIIISAITGREVIEAVPMKDELIRTTVAAPNDQRLETIEEANRRLGFLRLDYAAKVRDKDGNIVDVCIELQRANVPSQVERFRNYLAGQYSSTTNVGPDGKPLHIIAIYILGCNLPGVDYPLVRSVRTFEDKDHNIIGFDKPVPFIEALTDDIIIVQTTRVDFRPNSTLDRILNIFKQTEENRRLKSYPIDVDDYENDPDAMRVIGTLGNVLSNEKSSAELDLEREALDLLENFSQRIKNAEDGRTKAEEEIQRLAVEKQKAEAEKQQAQAQADQMRQLLKSLGLSDDEIDSKLKG